MIIMSYAVRGMTGQNSYPPLEGASQQDVVSSFANAMEHLEAWLEGDVKFVSVSSEMICLEDWYDGPIPLVVTGPESEMQPLVERTRDYMLLEEVYGHLEEQGYRDDFATTH